jgi:hypothetical protein
MRGAIETRWCDVARVLPAWWRARLLSPSDKVMLEDDVELPWAP